jgi:hypothetical protein
VTVSEHAQKFMLTDLALGATVEDAINPSDAVQKRAIGESGVIGRVAAEALQRNQDQDVTALFAALDSSTGSNSGPLTSTLLINGITTLNINNIPEDRRVAVLHSKQWQALLPTFDDASMFGAKGAGDHRDRRGGQAVRLPDLPDQQRHHGDGVVLDRLRGRDHAPVGDRAGAEGLAADDRDGARRLAARDRDRRDRRLVAKRNTAAARRPTAAAAPASTSTATPRTSAVPGGTGVRPAARRVVDHWLAAVRSSRLRHARRIVEAQKRLAIAKDQLRARAVRAIEGQYVKPLVGAGIEQPRTPSAARQLRPDRPAERAPRLADPRPSDAPARTPAKAKKPAIEEAGK